VIARAVRGGTFGRAGAAVGGRRCGFRRGALGLAAALAAGAWSAPANGETALRFDDFSDVSGLTLNGHADQALNSVLRLTPDLWVVSGTAFATCPVLLSPGTSFTTHFRFRLSGQAGTDGADGFTFVLQSSADGPFAWIPDSGGGWLGYEDLTPSIAVEFDTWQNGFDPDNNHVAVLADGAVEAHLAVAPAPMDLNGGDPVNVWISYDAAVHGLRVYVSPDEVQPAAPLLLALIDVYARLGPVVYAGFTAATGGSRNNHDIETWSFDTLGARDGTPGDLCGGDVDGDSVADAVDDCPFYNPDQTDTDGDAVGDLCDVDDDGDGWRDYVDDCPLVPDSDQADPDGDGVGAACDPDESPPLPAGCACRLSPRHTAPLPVPLAALALLWLARRPRRRPRAP
jgi:MYXO-CTERM domain-containing protein